MMRINYSGRTHLAVAVAFEHRFLQQRGHMSAQLWWAALRCHDLTAHAPQVLTQRFRLFVGRGGEGTEPIPSRIEFTSDSWSRSEYSCRLQSSNTRQNHAGHLWDKQVFSNLFSSKLS